MDKKARKETKNDKNKSKEPSPARVKLFDENADKETIPPRFIPGDYVVVKDGMVVPGCEKVDMSGWRGRIFEVIDDHEDEPPLLGVEWDSITLKSMPRSFVEESEEENLFWTELHLYDTAVLPSRRRDDELDVVRAIKEIREMYALDRFSRRFHNFDPLDAPTYDYLGARDLDDHGVLDEIVEFLPDSMRDYFLKWDAVLRVEQGLPLPAVHENILSELVSYGGDENAPIIYINDMARPDEPWYETIRKIASALVMDTFDTSEIHYASAVEGWHEIADCLEEHGKNLMLPEAANSPIDVVPKYIRHRLLFQCCLGELDGLGQKYKSCEDRVISLEDTDGEARIEAFIDALRDNRESLEYLDMTLERLYEILVLPPDDKEILTRAMFKEFGLSSEKDLIADFM